MSSIRNLKEAGMIVGEATSTEFIFSSENEEYPPKWEYLLIPSKEYVNGRLREVNVLAQVERIISRSDVLNPNLDIEALKRIKAAGINEVKTLGKARILGYIPEEDKIALIDASDVIALPSKHAGESYPLLVEEVKSRNKSLIVTDISPALASIVSNYDKGQVVSQDPHALAKAILAILGMKEKNSQHQRKIGSITWRRLAMKTISLYNHILKSSK